MKSRLVQGKDKYTSPPEMGIAGCIPQMGKSIFLTGKHMNYRYAMRSVSCGFFLCALALPGRQAPGRSPQRRMSGDAGTLASGKKDACTLLTTAEIEAVQGEPVKETKASVQLNGEMLVSECLFHTTNFSKSVSVALAVPASAKPSALAPRKFWQKQFHAPDVEEDKMRAPITGALYVLQGDNFVRISVGGVGEESVRIEKSKVLARAAVKRL